MYGNGAGTGMEHTRKEKRPTLWVPFRARPASYVVVAGAAARGSAVRLFVTSPRLATATTTWVSAWLAPVLKKNK